MKQTAVVVCPGRGGYNKPELGSIGRRHLPQQARLIDNFDRVRQQLGYPTVSELDSEPTFKHKVHYAPENSAALIYGAGYADFKAIDTNQYDIVAITGNSMGWYTALTCAGVWQPDSAMEIVTDMALRTAKADGAQLIYPVMNEQWQPDADKQSAIDAFIHKHPDELFLSIRYGGYALLAGTTEAIQAASKSLKPIDDRFPMILPGHAAFHSPLMSDASEGALKHWSVDTFSQPKTPLVDGRGVIWEPGAVNKETLKHYTFGHQVTECYDYSRAIRVALREFAPDKLLLLGPGNSLGGATGQALVAMDWRGINSKDAFSAVQEGSNAPVISLGL